MPTYTSFKNPIEVGDPLLSDSLQTNLVEFFDWGFLNIGNFFNVEIPTSGAYGGAAHRLRLSEDRSYTKGQVWEGYRKNWVWQSGIPYPTQPIQFSGVFVNGNFCPSSGVGAFAHQVDYINGRVIFDTAISSTATVTCEYSPKWFNVTDQAYPWIKSLQLNSFRVDSNHFHLYGSGDWSIPPEMRLQLPLINFRVLPQTRRKPRGIGSLYCFVHQDVEIDILAETDYDLKQAHDIITDQWKKTIHLFNKKTILDNQDAPLNIDGSLADSPKTYPDLVKPTGDGGYFWKLASFEDFRSVDNSQRLPVFHCKLLSTIETTSP